MTNPTQKNPINDQNSITNYKVNIDNSAVANGAPFTYNVSFSLAAGTFTVHGANGNALSASTVTDGNPAYFGFQDPDALSQLKWIEMSANQTFIDDSGSSNIIGNLFGMFTGVATTNDIVFTGYAVSNDNMDTVAIMLSRDPDAKLSPSAANIGIPASADADTLGSFFSLAAITVADYDTNPCTPIFTIRMQMSASDDWTVQTLAAQDGVGNFVNKGEWVLLEKITAATTTTIAFKIDTTFDDYKVVARKLLPATDAVLLHARTSTDAGATFDSGASDYNWSTAEMTNAAETYVHDNADTQIKLCGANGLSNVANEGGANGEITVWSPNDAIYTTLSSRLDGIKGGAARATIHMASGTRQSAANVDAIQFLLSSGDITSGDLILYGRKVS